MVCPLSVYGEGARGRGREVYSDVPLLLLDFRISGFYLERIFNVKIFV